MTPTRPLQAPSRGGRRWRPILATTKENEMPEKACYHVWQTSAHGVFSGRIDPSWYCDSFSSRAEAQNWAHECRELDGNDHAVVYDTSNYRKGFCMDSEGWGYLADERSPID